MEVCTENFHFNKNLKHINKQGEGKGHVSSRFFWQLRSHFHFHFQPLLLPTLASFSFAHVVKSSSKMAKGDFNVAPCNPHKYWSIYLFLIAQLYCLKTFGEVLKIIFSILKPSDFFFKSVLVKNEIHLCEYSRDILCCA